MQKNWSLFLKIGGGILVWALIIGAVWGFFQFRDSFSSFSFEGQKTVENREQTQEPTSTTSTQEQKDTRKPMQKALDDDDSDGLLNWEEYLYGTNPNKKDTDNDDYTDSKEIESGYNPTGEGELTSSQKQAKKKVASVRDRHKRGVPTEYTEHIKTKRELEEIRSKSEEAGSNLEEEQTFSSRLKAYFASVGVTGTLFKVLPLPFKGVVVVHIILTLVAFVINIFITALILNKVNNWWGNVPSKMETSLKIVGLLLLFSFVYGLIQFILNLALASSLDALNSIIFSIILTIIEFILYFVFFVFLMKKIYQTDYWNGLKIAVVSKVLSALIITVIGSILVLITVAIELLRFLLFAETLPGF